MGGAWEEKGESKLGKTANTNGAGQTRWLHVAELLKTVSFLFCSWLLWLTSGV